MSEWDEGYVAAALHDLKKVLLNDKPGPDDFGTWRPDHARLSDLSTQLTAGQQQTFASALSTTPCPPRLDLESADQVALVRVHHTGPPALPSGSSGELQRAALALQFADRAHKALYFWGEGSGEIRGVNWRCPWYCPFWGVTRRWTVEEAQERFLRAAQRIRERLAGGGVLDAEFLVRLGDDLLSDFGDSTFLPVTSLHFHHQLAAAIYLMVMKELDELGRVPLGRDPDDRKGREWAAVSLDLTRTVITLPAERLRYRLRDATHLRKIGQRLLIQAHKHLEGQYLSPSVTGAVVWRGFTHPHRSPLVFYGKEAIVILHRKADDQAIMEIARAVAIETETPIKVERQPLDLRDHALTHTGGTVTFSDLASRKINVRHVTAKRLQPETEWAMPSAEAPREASHECAACHKPIAPGQEKVNLEDKLCETCYRIRCDYRECPKCFALFPRVPECPFCGPFRERDLAPRHPVSPGRLIRVIDDVGGERAAIIAVRIGAMPDAMEAESELRLAQFREERIAGEEAVLRSCGLSEGALRKELGEAKKRMPLVHGTGGVLEYLQAVLEIGRKQDEWQQWLAEELYGGEAAEAAAHFVYRSPALTVLLVAESFLRAAYRKIVRDLENLHIAHRLDIVTCDTHYPIYDALASLFRGPGRTLEEARRLDEARAAAREFRDVAGAAYQAWRADQTAVPGADSPVVAAHQRLHAAAQEASGPCLTYRVIRGGNARVFQGKQARQLLEVEPSRQASSQLHALALLAEQLAAVAPEGDEGATETLLMDLEGRSRYVAEDMRELAASILRDNTPMQAAQHLRELARAIRP